jgi:hypothetical protein
MIHDTEDVITLEALRLLRRGLTEIRELTIAIQTLADRVDRLTAELADGELLELTKLAARALRALEAAPNRNGGPA